ncbi:MAG: 1-phosphofructokinase family hexose kinase, partial [Micromonosporaceae bacterium]
MILTVTVNAALDVTYTVDRLAPHTVHRVGTVAERAGGKGLNVARLLHVLGEPVTATGLAGGHTGARITQLLATDGVTEAFGGIAGESRRTVVVHSDGDATGFWEPGPEVSNDEWSEFTTRFTDLLGHADVVTLSGSLPAGVPADGYATLVAAARQAGLPVVLDADGAPLRHGLTANPTVVKPNADELTALIGHRPHGVDETVAAASRLYTRHGSAVVASLGA